MTIKQWLSRATNLDREIDDLISVRDEIKARLLSVTASNTGDTVQSSKDPHKMDAYIEIEDRINRKIDEYVKTKKEILFSISELENPNSRTVLISRYLKNMTWPEIAVSMSYSERHITRLHGQALYEFSRLQNATD